MVLFSDGAFCGFWGFLFMVSGIRIIIFVIIFPCVFLQRMKKKRVLDFLLLIATFFFFFADLLTWCLLSALRHEIDRNRNM